MYFNKLYTVNKVRVSYNANVVFLFRFILFYSRTFAHNGVATTYVTPNRIVDVLARRRYWLPLVSRKRFAARIRRFPDDRVSHFAFEHVLHLTGGGPSTPPRRGRRENRENTRLPVRPSLSLSLSLCWSFLPFVSRT